MKYFYFLFFVLQSSLIAEQYDLSGRWAWSYPFTPNGDTNNKCIIVFSNGIGYKEGGNQETKNVALNYRLVDPKYRLFKIQWISKSTGQVWFSDYLFLQDNNNLIGINSNLKNVKAFRIKY